MPEASAHPGLFSTDVEQAEDILLELADFLYANSKLKPMSKTLFAISRLLLTVHENDGAEFNGPKQIENAYAAARESLGDQAPSDDYSFGSVLELCEPFLPRILSDMRSLLGLTDDRDTLGLVFDTLVRGKWDTGEGLGTFLTPEEVVEPMVAMVLAKNEALTNLDSGPDGAPRLFGDICGGTGRFVRAFARELRDRGMSREEVSARLRLFDQSSFAVDLARLNLYFSGVSPRCEVVSDSLTSDAVSDLDGRFAALATNPPFGATKYEVTRELREALPAKVLEALENQGRTDSLDPSALFAFRNLNLLAHDGVLAIVLPDGVVQSSRFVAALRAYEKETGSAVEVRALVSLPPVTFSLGGTVAKTSFLVLSKKPSSSNTPLFHAEAEHVGFLRSGNRRVEDPEGNDLIAIVEDYLEGPDAGSESWEENWRDWDRLGLTLAEEQVAGPEHVRLGDLVESVREYTSVERDSASELHISITDVDETGLLDIVSVSKNHPSSRVLECKPGDVLVSCINPRIWRVAVVPDIEGRWTCSSEFLVLRPDDLQVGWQVGIRLHHQSFISNVRRMAGGTSSSRQRVPKEEVLRLHVPEVQFSLEAVSSHRQERESIYRTRLAEATAYNALHAGSREFDPGG